MFNQIKKGSRFTCDGQTYIVLEVMGNYYRLQAINTKKEVILPLAELKNNYSSLDDYVTPEEEQTYLRWAIEVMESPQVKKAITTHQQKEKLEKILEQ